MHDGAGTFQHKEPVTPAEIELQAAVRAWRACELAEVFPDIRRDDRIVRAGFIRYLVLEGDKRSFVHEKGVHLDGAYIEGELDFLGCEIKRPLFLKNCRFSSPLSLTDARTCTIRLDGSLLAGIDAQRVKVAGSLYLHGCTVDGEITLIDGDITGSLECHGACIKAPAASKYALYASRLKTVGSVFLHQGCAISGEVSFRGATIHGNLECTSGKFSNTGGVALSCSGLVTDGNVFLNNGFSAVGGVDFTGATVRGNFLCDGGHFDKASSLMAFCAKRARIEGSVYLRKLTNGDASEGGLDFTALGETNFVDAKIGGSLECHGGSFLNGGGVALYCSRTSVAGGVFLHEGFTAEGEVVFRNAEIGSNIDASDAYFNSGCTPSKEDAGRKSLSCERLRTRGSFFLKRSRVKYQVNLTDADIEGSLECHGAHFGNPYGITLFCSRAKIDGSVFLHEKLISKGKIVLRSAEIGGNLDVSDAHLSCEGFSQSAGRERKSLCCERARIKGSVFLKNTVAMNQVDFIDATIDGSLECHGAEIHSTGEIALYCSRAKIGGSVFLHNGFKVQGAAVFHRASIGGNVDCDTGTFTAAGGTAIDLEGVTIPGYVRMGNGFRATGEVRLAAADIGGYLGCSGGTFSNIRPRRDIQPENGTVTASHDGHENICADALKLRGAVIKNNLWLGPSNRPPHHTQTVIEGSLDLRDVSAAVLIDDEHSWPVPEVQYEGRRLTCHIYLDGFTYNRIGGRSSLDLRVRKRWLMRQPPADLVTDYKAQAFEQLIRVLRETGHTDDARAMAIYKERCRVMRPIQGGAGNGWPWWTSLVNWWQLIAFDAIAGWGYRAHRVVIAAIAFWLLCALVYRVADQNGLVHPADLTAEKAEVCRQAKAIGNAEVNKSCPQFSPLKFSLDVMLPVVQLHEKAAWKFDSRELAIWPNLIDALKSLENVFGWIAGVIFAALLGRKINKE